MLILPAYTAFLEHIELLQFEPILRRSSKLEAHCCTCRTACCPWGDRLYPPCLGTALRKNRPLVPRSNSRTTFSYQGIGFFMVLVDAGQLFRCAGQHFMMMQSPSILTSQNSSLNQSLSQPQSPKQHESLAPRGSTDSNSGWCITGRRVSRPNQLNIRSFHARWEAAAWTRA